MYVVRCKRSLCHLPVNDYNLPPPFDVFTRLSMLARRVEVGSLWCSIAVETRGFWTSRGRKVRRAPGGLQGGRSFTAQRLPRPES